MKRKPLLKRAESFKTVIVTVEGGVVQHVRVPQGVKVIVEDWDDDSEEKCCRSTWYSEVDEVKLSGRG